ncbi:MAG: hypothetical protein DYG94_08215 [Leptolyngbya sp. PLA3]|nr:MAG: hypothetical protein EDM82_09345 [Cyanobacteria bacterium CYA]MCE7968716.1 hypothetical protein [Leptolyngbya sp. PL-A3]
MCFFIEMEWWPCGEIMIDEPDASAKDQPGGVAESQHLRSCLPLRRRRGRIHHLAGASGMHISHRAFVPCFTAP